MELTTADYDEYYRFTTAEPLPQTPGLWDKYHPLLGLGVVMLIQLFIVDWMYHKSLMGTRWS